MKVIIILGYGVFTEDNLQYKSYLDEVLNKISRLNPDFIITTGSMTNKKHPKLTESSSQRNYLVKQQSNLDTKILLETKSLSTPENIEFSKELLESNHIVPDKITIICDSIRAPKVFYLAATYLKDLLHLESSEEDIYRELFKNVTDKKMDVTQEAEYIFKNLSIIGINLHRSMEEVGLQITSSMIEVGFTKYPELEKEFLVWRKKQFDLS